MAIQQIRPPVQSDIYGSTGDLLGSVVGAFHAAGFTQASPPFRRGFNATLNHIDKVATYLLQGISELTVGESYAINRVMLSTINNQLYKSKLNQIYIANDELDPTKWELYLGTNAIHKHADYNATTNIPNINDINNFGLYVVTTAGFVSGVSIQGALTTGGSYLMVNDIVFNNNGNLELFRSEIIGAQTINYGTGTFLTLGAVNNYINQRLYTELTLNQTANTVETASVNITNDCGGALTIKCNGFTIAMNAGFNCEISGSNVLIDNFKLTGDFDGYLLKVHDVLHQNDVSVTNTHATTVFGGIMHTKSFLGVTDNDGVPASSITVGVQSVAKIALFGHNSNFSCFNLNTNGFTVFGQACNNVIHGAINTGGGDISCNESGCNHIAGAITTGGGYFWGGSSCSNYIQGSINTGGGYFYGGNSCSNVIAGAITTGGGYFHGGTSCSNNISGTITTGGGLFNGGNSCSNVISGAITTGGGNFIGGNNCSTYVNNSISGNVGSTFTFFGGTRLYVFGNITGYTVAAIQEGQALYAGATSAAVLRNQNTNGLMAN